MAQYFIFHLNEPMQSIPLDGPPYGMPLNTPPLSDMDMGDGGDGAYNFQDARQMKMKALLLIGLQIQMTMIDRGCVYWR